MSLSVDSTQSSVLRGPVFLVRKLCKKTKVLFFFGAASGKMLVVLGRVNEGWQAGEAGPGWYWEEFYLEMNCSQATGRWTIWRSFFFFLNTPCTLNKQYFFCSCLFLCFLYAEKLCLVPSILNILPRIRICSYFLLQWVRCFHQIQKTRCNFGRQR